MEALSDTNIRILIYGFWIPAFIAGLTYFIYKYFFSRSLNRNFFQEDRYFSEIRKENEYMQHRTLRELDRIIEELNSKDSLRNRNTEALFEKFADQIKYQNSQNMHALGITDRKLSALFEKALEKNIQNLNLNSNILKSPETIQTISEVNLIRELSHALHTPLSRITAISQNIRNNSTDVKVIEKMENAQSAVEVCTAYLASYRQIIDVTSKTSTWNPESLKMAIQSSANIYMEAREKSLKFVVTAPKKIERFSNVFLLSIVLPLIENAVEASTDKDQVSVSISASKVGNVTIVVKNPILGVVDTGKIFDRNYSTKNSTSNVELRHRGLGLTIVQTLIASVPKSKISAKVKEGTTRTISFRVYLPKSGIENV